MKPLTAAEIRAAIASQVAPESRDIVTALCFSACDIGITLGLANAARAANPFAVAVVAESKKRR